MPLNCTCKKVVKTVSFMYILLQLQQQGCHGGLGDPEPCWQWELGRLGKLEKIFRTEMGQFGPSLDVEAREREGLQRFQKMIPKV